MVQLLRIRSSVPRAVLIAWLSHSLAAVADENASYNAARAALEHRNFAAAGAIFQALVAEHPENADYLLGLGQTRLALRDATGALSPLERAHKLSPAYLDVLQVLADAYVAAGRIADARIMYERADQLAPQTQWVHDGLRITKQLSATDQCGKEQATSDDNPVAPLPVSRSRLTISTSSEFTGTERHDTWHESGLGFNYAWTPRAQVSLRAARSQRFDRNDTLLEVEGSVPIFDDLTIAGRAIVSPTHRARVREGGVIEASVAMPLGLVMTAGGGRMVYNEGPSDLLTATFESYVTAFRFAYTGTVVQAPHSDWSPNHRLVADWYYGAENRIGISISYGEESDATILGLASIFDTWGVGFNGRHWLTTHFALDCGAAYNGLKSPKGDHLDRTTFYIGVALRP